MSNEQPGLFDELKPKPGIDHNVDQKSQRQRSTPEKLVPFLPGVKLDEAWPEVSNYEVLKETALQCRGCGLRTTCQQVVFGEGDTGSRVMLIGEGPGRDEDIKGRPFVGRAGQLLDRILLAAELQREKTYITNVVKCRPPGNRLPHPDEIRQCRNFLEKQIRLIKPAIIVCLGALASQVVIDPRARISKVRGQWFKRQNIKIMATYHPAALLRNESYKRPVWEDFKRIRDEYQNLSDR
ncbi:uracil-DNA glycosylase [Syntrophomonas erecta]